MVVSKIEELTKTRYKVFIDGEFAFVLYKGELSRYHLKEEAPITEEVYEALYKLVVKRGKLRALHLLNDMGRTEYQLRDKLDKGGYPKGIVEEVLAYVKSFGYIDDRNYARNFILAKKASKSKKQIQALLLQKGVSSEIISEIFLECYGEEDVYDAIEKALLRRRFDSDAEDEKYLQKHLMYLARKGFAYGDIKHVLLDRFHKSV